MRVETIERELYKFSELTNEAQNKAIDKYREGNLEYDWYDYTIDTFKELGKLIGLDIDNIYFSGFCSQGDGACFTGSYDYKKGSLSLIKEEYPKDSELHSIVKSLQEVQKMCFYGLTATIEHKGRYYHENSNYIYLTCDNEYLITDNVEDDLIDSLRGLMQWMYSKLEDEYNYLQSDDVIKEQLNDLEFTELGEIA